MPDFNADNTHHRALIRFRFGWNQGAGGEAALGSVGYVEPPFLDESTTPPDWISVKVNGQLHGLPYAARNGDRIILRIVAPSGQDQSRIVRMTIGDVVATVIVTTAQVSPPPSYHSYEPPMPPMVSPPPPRQIRPPPPPKPPIHAPPWPPMPPMPVAAHGTPNPPTTEPLGSDSRLVIHIHDTVCP